MKKLLSLLIVVFPVINTYGQYKTFNFKGYEYKTDCFYNKKDFISIKIELQSLDEYPIELYISSPGEYQSFMRRLDLLKVKMIEWDSICIKNDIGKINKLIDFKVNKNEKLSVWFGRNYNNCDPLNVYVRENDTSKIIFHTGVIRSLTNEYINSKGGIIIFYSSQEIDEMIKAFNLSNIQSYIDNKNEKLELLR